MIVIDGNGKSLDLKEWQQSRGLKADNLGPHFKIGEFACGKELIISEALIDFLEALRTRVGRPLKINSGYRTNEKQLHLKAQGYRAAMHSPHTKGMAADIDTESKGETVELVGKIKQLAADLKFPIRIGYRQYMNIGQTFVHVDVCPKYYAPGMPLEKENHPEAWAVDGLTW